MSYLRHRFFIAFDKEPTADLVVEVVSDFLRGYDFVDWYEVEEQFVVVREPDGVWVEDGLVELRRFAGFQRRAVQYWIEQIEDALADYRLFFGVVDQVSDEELLGSIVFGAYDFAGFDWLLNLVKFKAGEYFLDGGGFNLMEDQVLVDDAKLLRQEPVGWWVIAFADIYI